MANLTQKVIRTMLIKVSCRLTLEVNVQITQEIIDRCIINAVTAR